MKLRVTALALVLALLSVFVITPNHANAAPAPTTHSLTSAGTITGIAGTYNGTNFTDGVLQVTNFAVNSAGQLVASGTFSSATAGVTSTFTAPITSATTQAACKILTLTLGPIHLDLLGLVVDTNTINLNITAQPGPGNLLGNLLCSVANLLNGGLGLNGLANLLNQLLAGL